MGTLCLRYELGDLAKSLLLEVVLGCTPGSLSAVVMAVEHVIRTNTQMPRLRNHLMMCLLRHCCSWRRKARVLEWLNERQEIKMYRLRNKHMKCGKEKRRQPVKRLSGIIIRKPIYCASIFRAEAGTSFVAKNNNRRVLRGFKAGRCLRNL